MEKAQRAEDRKMGTAEEKGKEQLNPLVRKRAGKRADAKCRTSGWRGMRQKTRRTPQPARYV
ncbi:MAG: hypothetical protein A2176_15835 [Spirochaetes bacterium RBG_13_51_14]|nr:MAG: hypothetical protein A2176_15835 [Spirochaetes bacterium RBG_13_51_14]